MCSRYRMGPSKFGTVQMDAVACIDRLGCVGGVTDNGVSQGSCVTSDLVGATRVDAPFHEGCHLVDGPSTVPEHLKARRRRASMAMAHLPRSVIRWPPSHAWYVLVKLGQRV